jgi:predicted N-acyltransferase
VVGPRLLVGAGAHADARRGALLAGLRELMLGEQLSSTHLLFLEADDLAACAHDHDDAHWLARSDVQFHWCNRDWHTFEDFLAALKHKKRKNIRAERAQVAAADPCIEWRAGASLDAREWRTVHALYLDTFDTHGNHAALSADFFAHLGATLPGQVWLALARMDAVIVAMALFLSSSSTLYGRYWGSRVQMPGLHFELCYYQGIEHCLRAGLQRFEPGAQGEHKLARGFLPTLTHSRHAIAHAGLRHAIAQYLAAEHAQVLDWRGQLLAHSPYAE